MKKIYISEKQIKSFLGEDFVSYLDKSDNGNDIPKDSIKTTSNEVLTTEPGGKPVTLDKVSAERIKNHPFFRKATYGTFYENIKKKELNERSEKNSNIKITPNQSAKINKDDETCKQHRKKTYYDIRDKYNETKDPYMFFFLMRTCINGLIRFNNNTGNFNSSCAYARPGMHPDKIKEIITDINSLLVKYNVQFYNKSYNEVLNEAPENSVIYLDPPYYESFGMYYGKFDFKEFNENISKYANKHRKVIISFDNKPVDEIDFSLYNRHKIYSGKSGFKKLHKEDTEVFESLYVSK